MENNSITKLIVGFLVLIVGIVLIGSIATETNTVVDKKTIGSEILNIALDRDLVTGCTLGVNGTHTFTIVNAPTGWKQSDCPITNFVMLNQTGETAEAITDYVFSAVDGTLLLVNTSVWSDCNDDDNETIISYVYCGDDYLNLAWGRTILNLISGFFALALLGVAVGLFYSVAKDAGIIAK